MPTALRSGLVAALLASVALGQVTIPPHSAVYNGYSRGYNFTAAANFIITQLALPPEAFQAGDTASYLVRVNGNVALRSVGNAGAITTNVVISPGDVVDIIGNWSPATTGNFTAHNSYTVSGNYAATIVGVPHTLIRTGWQWDIGDAAWQSGTYLTPVTGQLGRVLMYAQPPAGLYPDFSATPTRGASPLAVQFTDLTYSSDPGGVLAWQWDFDGDSIVDSTLRNPSFTYTNCGSYNVSLTAIDATHGPVTVTKNNYIVTDTVTPNFTYSVLPGNVVQFTDTSTPTPTSWAWDFDGDNVVDSTAQNPAFLFPTQNPYQTRLTVSRLCGPQASVTKTVRAALLVTTVFSAGNGGSSGWGVLFDLNITNPTGVVLTSLDHNISSAASTPFTIDLYITPNTYVGAQTNAALWRRVATGSGSAAGPNLPSPTPLSNPVFLAAGSYGVAVYYNGASMSYTNGNGSAVPGSGTNQTYGNGDLTLLAGESRTALWGTGVNVPRVWNGTIYYDKLGFGNRAGYTFFQAGCAGTMGMTNLTASQAPVLGQTMSVAINNLPLNLAIMVFGFSRTTSIYGPLPIDLGILGAPGCPLRVSNDANFVLFGAGNAATWNVPIPNATALIGMQFYDQAFVPDPAANAFGAVTSDAAAACIGL